MSMKSEVLRKAWEAANAEVRPAIDRFDRAEANMERAKAELKEATIKMHAAGAAEGKLRTLLYAAEKAV